MNYLKISIIGILNKIINFHDKYVNIFCNFLIYGLRIEEGGEGVSAKFINTFMDG